MVLRMYSSSIKSARHAYDTACCLLDGRTAVSYKVILGIPAMQENSRFDQLDTMNMYVQTALYTIYTATAVCTDDYKRYW